MTEKTNPAAANAADAPKPDAVATAAAVPATPAAAAAPAQPDAQATERARISGILTHAEAEGRNALANHLAFNTTSSVADAVAILAASSKATAPAANALAAAMANVPNPNVGADGKPAAAPGTAATQLNHSNIYNSRKLVAVK